MFLDNENSDSETSVEVSQQVNEEPSDNTIQGILTFQYTHTQIFNYKAY